MNFRNNIVEEEIYYESEINNYCIKTKKNASVFQLDILLVNHNISVRLLVELPLLEVDMRNFKLTLQC